MHGGAQSHRISARLFDRHEKPQQFVQDSVVEQFGHVRHHHEASRETSSPRILHEWIKWETGSRLSSTIAPVLLQVYAGAHLASAKKRNLVRLEWLQER